MGFKYQYSGLSGCSC